MRDKLTPIIDAYIKGGPARAVALQLVLALYNLEQLMRTDTPSTSLRSEILMTFAAVFLDLPANPFWRDNAGYLTPIVASATNAWLDAGAYMQRSAAAGEADPNASAEALVRGVGLRAAMIEIVLATLYCEQGAGSLRKASVDMRDALLKVLE